MRWLIVFLLIAGVCYAGDFQDFGTNDSGGTFNDTRFFSGETIFSASDITAQLAFQTLDASGVRIIQNCKITDDFCWKFENSILNLWVNGKRQNLFPF